MEMEKQEDHAAKRQTPAMPTTIATRTNANTNAKPKPKTKSQEGIYIQGAAKKKSGTPLVGR
jgi:hypothetical protein